MPNDDRSDLKTFDTTPQGRSAAGSYEAKNFTGCAPKQVGETQQDANRRWDSFNETKRGS